MYGTGWNMPAGASTAAQERWYGDETRRPCDQCNGSGQLCQRTGKPLSTCDCETFNRDCEPVKCSDCEDGWERSRESRVECEQDMEEDDDIDY